MAHPNAKSGDQPVPSNSSRITDRQRPPYACHLCKNRYQWGKKLSIHLRTKHSLRLPPGFSKFTYQLCEDGCRRLQTTRVDSLEVIQQILGKNEVERLLANEQAGSSDPQPDEGTEMPATVSESEQDSCIIIDLQRNELSSESRIEAPDEIVFIPEDVENPL